MLWSQQHTKNFSLSPLLVLFRIFFLLSFRFDFLSISHDFSECCFSSSFALAACINVIYSWFVCVFEAFVFLCALYSFIRKHFSLSISVFVSDGTLARGRWFSVCTQTMSKKSISQCFVVYVPSSTEKWHGLPRRFIIITWTENKIYASEIFSKVINHFGSLFQTRFAGIHHFDVSLFTFRCWRAYGIEHFPHEVHSATSTFAKNSPKRKQFTLCHQKMHSARKKLLILIKNKNEIFMETLICVDCRLTMNRYKI